MKFNDIIKQLAETTPEQLESKSNRRDILKGLGVKAAAAAIPFAATSLYSKPAKAQSKETIINVLNYLLKLEQINFKFYAEAFAKDGFIPEAYTEQFTQVQAHVQGHMTTLRNNILQLGGTPENIDFADIDLTGNRGLGGGPFSKAFSTHEDFLILMTVLCDAGVRIYKGQVVEVFSDKTTVSRLMNIQSVKARHATFARYLRWYWAGADTKPWITGNDSDTVNTAAQRAYAGESNVEQAGIGIVGINGFDINSAHATQSFDEPLNMVDGNNILDRFINQF